MSAQEEIAKIAGELHRLEGRIEAVAYSVDEPHKEKLRVIAEDLDAFALRLTGIDVARIADAEGGFVEDVDFKLGEKYTPVEE